MSGKLTKAELKRLEELKLKLDLQQKKLNTQKSKIAKEKKGLDAEKKKINSEWKALDRAKKKFEDQREVASKQSMSANRRNSTKSRNNSNKKFQDQFVEMKQKYQQESKKSREYKKRLDQLEVENKVLRNKVKNLSGRKRGKGNDKRLRQLIRENRELRKRLRKLMKELNKRRRWYKRAIKIFKKNQDKWIRKQRDAFKGKKFIIKYVFLDDVKYIKQYQRPRKGRDKIQFKNRIRVKTKGGGETTVKDVEIIVLDADQDDSDDDSTDNDYDTDDKNGKGKKKKKKKKKGGKGDGDEDDDTDDKDGKGKKKKKKKKGGKSEADEDEEDDGDDKDGKGKKKKKKKKGKSAADEEDEIEKFMEEMMSEFNISNAEIEDDEEDIKSDIDDIDEDDDDDDEDDDDYKDDTNDENDEDDKDDDINIDELLADKNEAGSAGLEAQIVYLKQEMDERGRDLEKLKDIMTGDAATDETGEKVKEEVDKLMNDIGQRQDEMVSNLEDLGGDKKDNEAIAEGNNQWKNYMLNLSKIVLGNTEEFGKLLNIINEGFLKELNGRIEDLKGVNNIYYMEDEKLDIDGLKDSVNKRHEEISNGIKEKRGDENDENENEKTKELYDGLLNTNVNWNELIVISGNMFGESQSEKNKLIEAVMGKYNKLEELMGKVDKLPSTVLF